MTVNKIPENIDAIVVGTGVGGATLGFALAKAGKRVVFCECGPSQLQENNGFKGHYAEQLAMRHKHGSDAYASILRKSGRWSDKIIDKSSAVARSFIPLIGMGTGGSSSLYGMAMERFFPSDFQPGDNFLATEKANLPQQWPISYEQLEAYYREAEALYQLRGTSDPLRGLSGCNVPPPPPLTAPNEELFNFFEAKKLHPYRLPLACQFVEGCQGCQGFLCARDCKNDSQKICLEPAVNQYGAVLLDNCEVVRLDSNLNQVTGVLCRINGDEVRLQAKLVVLAAGALRTPQLLLNSTSSEWPHGLANESGLVGRNLMRHFVDLYAISTKSKKISGHMKEIGLNDFYNKEVGKLGTVQSFGHLPPPAILAESIEQELKQKSQLLGVFFKLAKPFAKLALSFLLTNKVILVSILEDAPYLDNQVCIDPHTQQLIIKYTISLQSQKRIEKFRDAMRLLLKPYRFLELKQAESNERIAHACGTCRFGDNPKESVLNRNNRAHGVTNLYVVDSSFFPSSAGTNPSLTIAANALRVATHLLKQVLPP